MSTHVNYDNMYSLLAGVVQNLKTKINAIDLTADQKAKLAIIDKIIKTGNGTNFLSNDGTYKNIPLDQLGPMSDKIGVINSLFNIVTQAEHWDSTGIANIPTSRQYLTSVLYNGKIYCIGGMNINKGTYTNIVEIYDIANNTWTTGTNMPTVRYTLTSQVYNGKIYCIGGCSSIGALNKVEIYDIANNTWTTGTPMPTARYGLTSVFYNGKIYCIGGYSSGLTNTVEIYDIANNSWTTGTPMTTARYNLTSQVYNNKIHCIGGCNASGSNLNIVEIYDITNNTWTTGTPIPTARCYLTSQIYNGKIYCIGGGANSGLKLNVVEIYDISNNSWTTGAPMPTARNSLTSQIYNNKIYCIGGTNSGLSTLEILWMSYSTYSINTPQSIIDKLSLLITNGTGNKLLTDNGTYQEYIPSGYRQLNTTEINTLTDYIKNNL